MAVNPYFNNKNYKPTQNLFEDLSDEVIKMNGIDVIYIIKTTDKVDNLFGDNQHGKLKNSFTIEMYLSTAKNFQGDRDVISKFGMEIKLLPVKQSKKVWDDAVEMSKNYFKK